MKTLPEIATALDAYYTLNPSDPGDHLYDAALSLQEALWHERNPNGADENDYSRERLGARELGVGRFV